MEQDERIASPTKHEAVSSQEGEVSAPSHEMPGGLCEAVCFREYVEELFQKALSRLPEEYRSAITLQRDRGLDDRASAALLGVSEDCLRMRASKAREIIREVLKEGGVRYEWRERTTPQTVRRGIVCIGGKRDY